MAPSDTPASAAKGEAVAWHRADSSGQTLLYTLRQDGWRAGRPLMVNDLEVRIQHSSGAAHDLEAIIDTILAALQPHPSQQADPVPPEWTGQGTDADFFVAPETKFSRASQQAGTEGVTVAKLDAALRLVRAILPPPDLERVCAALNPSEVKG